MQKGGQRKREKKKTWKKHENGDLKGLKEGEGLESIGRRQSNLRWVIYYLYINVYTKY